MFGENPIRGIEVGDGQTLFVQEIFPTIQGEGPFVGVPSVFIRLGGCNLACKFCDTEFEDFSPMRVDEIIEKALSHNKDQKLTLAVITGGEPMRQPIELLCAKLLASGFAVQIETNGTLNRPLPPEVNIVCSPKATKNGYIPIRPDLLERLNALKFLISKDQQWYGDVPDLGQAAYQIPVYLQPMDEYDPEKNQQNTELTLSLVKKYGYRLSLQVHKFLDIP